MDSRVKHGNDRKWGGVMPTRVIFKLLHGMIWHPSGFSHQGLDSRVSPVKQMLRFHGSGTGMTEKGKFPVLVRSFFLPLVIYSG